MVGALSYLLQEEHPSKLIDLSPEIRYNFLVYLLVHNSMRRQILFFGTMSHRPKAGQTFVAEHLVRAINRTLTGGDWQHMVVRNMSDFLTNQVIALDPSLTPDEVDRLKDEPGSGVRPLMSAMSQFVRRNDKAALAKLSFHGMQGGVMTAMKFFPDVDILVERVREHGGGLVVVKTSDLVWETRLRDRGLSLPSSSDAVEVERPKVTDIVDRCIDAGIKIWYVDNDLHLTDDPDNEAFNNLCRIAVEAHETIPSTALVVR